MADTIKDLAEDMGDLKTGAEDLDYLEDLETGVEDDLG